MAENGSVSGQYEGDNYASPSPSTGSGNSIRQMGGNSKDLFDSFHFLLIGFHRKNKFLKIIVYCSELRKLFHFHINTFFKKVDN